MPPSITAGNAWPDPWTLLPRLLLSFALALGLIWLGGRQLVEALLPLAHGLVLWIDDRFTILFLGIDQTAQDTVIRLRVNLVRPVVVGSRLLEPHPQGWLEVTTTVGAMLQPLAIALGLAGAWPAKLLNRLLAVATAAGLGLLFMIIDIPLTLHAYVWDMLVFHYDPQRFSPLMAVHNFLHGGGRLGVGILFGVIAAYVATDWNGKRQSASRAIT